MTRFQPGNPLDLLFFAGDRALRAGGHPGAHVLMVIELDEPIDVGALREALTRLMVRYPTLNGRGGVGWFSRRMGWRLDPRRPLPEAAVRVEPDRLADDAAQADMLERLLMTSLDYVAAPPVQFHVWQRADGGDTVVLRWPHALMDGGGVLQFLVALDDAHANARSAPAGDERLRDFGRALRRGRAAYLRAGGPRLARGPTIEPASGPGRGGPGRMRIVIRRLTPAETQSVASASRAIAGRWPSGRFVRACAIRALHEHLTPPPQDGVYRTNAMVDCRPDAKRSMCWNFSAALPIVVPAAMAGDCRRTADLIRDQMQAHQAAGTAWKQLAALWLVTRMPTWTLAALIRPGLFCEDGRPRGLLGSAPRSLAADLLPPPARALTTFCGAAVRTFYDVPTIPPRPGLALNPNLTHDRLNVSGVCSEPGVARALLVSIVDRFVVLLKDPV